MIIGNVGDSRAILGTKVEDESLVAVQLTVDLKPNLPRMYQTSLSVLYFFDFLVYVHVGHVI